MTRPLPDGSLAAVLTPLTASGTVDRAALDRLIRWIAEGGVSGLVVLGSSGEVAALDPAQRREVVTVAVETAHTRGLPVIVGVANPCQAGALEDITAAGALGADAVLVAPPYYAPLDQLSVRRFYDAVGARAELPVLGYHIPAFTGVPLDPATVAALAADGILAGVKDSNRDLEYFQQMLAIGAGLTRPWSVYTGTDSLLLPALTLGATGGITLAANIVPSWTARLAVLAQAGEIAAAADVQTRLTDLILTLRRGPFPAGGKAALSVLGLAGPGLVAPAAGLDEKETAILAAELTRIGVTPDAEVAS
ncbi:dihydrodipicolinate synthase family protein [Streptomyces sp. NPDC048636]|uniref:dihydrodipicolinate synthase family protein n=1 Tax=Streptomyces sp. NPDC048636 TaxID=3155762 RepID=UPI0034402CB2